MKIYTKTGDDGSTGLFSGKRVSKCSSFVEAYGSVDELNSFVGFSIAACNDEQIKGLLVQIQHDLFVLGADLATPMDRETKIERLKEVRISRLEQNIDDLDEELDELKEFILPGGSELASRLHLCRVVSRRAERRLTAHCAQNEVNELCIIYLNRLSDLFFILARTVNKRSQMTDTHWDQSR